MKKIIIADKEYIIAQESDIITADGSKGKKYWKALVLQKISDNTWYTSSESWHDTLEGESKHIISIPYRATSKNIGKQNETSDEQQAFLEYKSDIRKAMDIRQSKKTLPILAKKFLEREKKIKFDYTTGIYVSAKIDGNRFLYDGIEGWSRGGKDVIPEIYDHLHFDTKGYIIDGELVLPGNPAVNKTSSAIKKYHPGISDQLEYHVFDIVDEKLPYSERYTILENIVSNCGNSFIKLVKCYLVHSRDEILEKHAEFTNAGFEGSIIRNFNGLYKPGKRTDDLLKFKDFQTEEFKIVNVISAGGGSSEFVAKFVCVDEKGDEFESTAMGTEEIRREYLENKENYINKYAVIKFRELSGKNNVPFHSNVLDIRDTKSGGY